MSYDKLSSEPHVLKTDLNEWLRFDRPGVYWLQVESSRVSIFHEQVSSAWVNRLVVNSNKIEITVLPADAAWISGEMNDIKGILDSSSSRADQKTIAASRLRYLNTESSMTEMIRRLPETVDEPCHYALYEGLLEFVVAKRGHRDASANASWRGHSRIMGRRGSTNDADPSARVRKPAERSLLPLLKKLALSSQHPGRLGWRRPSHGSISSLVRDRTSGLREELTFEDHRRLMDAKARPMRLFTDDNAVYQSLSAWA